jgi:hypothetical protein
MTQHYSGGARPPKSRAKKSPTLFARDATAAELLRGCPVVTAQGERIGHVSTILVDAKTRQIRYVMLDGSGRTSIAIPWHALYFDSALIRLVFYTYS